MKVVNAELSNSTIQNVTTDQWYFLDSGSNNAFMNMAIDEFLTTTANLDVPLLRVYQWQPFAISIGYNQRISDIDLEKCHSEKIDLVRRPTGGRAVLHAEEVTYAIIIPKKATVWYQNSVLATYNRISQGLVAGLNELGLQLSLQQRSEANTTYAAGTTAAIPCFTAAAQYEVMYQDRKLIGSAQRRFEKGVLQHGSVLTGNFHLQLPRFLKIANDPERQMLQKNLEEKTISIHQILNHPISYREVVNAMVAGFIKKYQITFKVKTFSHHELKTIKALSEKYHKTSEVIS